jgi:hypothetical protein
LPWHEKYFPKPIDFSMMTWEYSKCKGQTLHARNTKLLATISGKTKMFTIATVQNVLTNLATLVEIAFVASIALCFLISLIPIQNACPQFLGVNSHAEFIDSVKFAFSEQNDPDEDVSDGHEDDEKVENHYPTCFIDQLTVRQLREFARKKGVVGYSKILREGKAEGLRKVLRQMA